MRKIRTENKDTHLSAKQRKIRARKIRTPIFQPSAAIQMRTLKNGQQVFGNVAAPGLAYLATGPVNQLQVIVPTYREH
jgi:hypothetical protein